MRRRVREAWLVSLGIGTLFAGGAAAQAPPDGARSVPGRAEDARGGRATTGAEEADQLRMLRLFVGGAPGPDGRPDLSGMTSLLLENAALREELGLSERQEERLREAAGVVGRRREELMGRLRDEGGGQDPDRREGEIARRPEGGGGFGPEEMRAAIGDLGRESVELVGRILTAKQEERLYQIALRIEGPTAVARPDVAARLHLSPAQQDEVVAIVERMKAGRQGAMVARMEGTGAAPGARVAGSARRPAPEGRRDGRGRPKGERGTGRPAGDDGRHRPQSAAEGWGEIREAVEEQDRLLEEAERRIARVLTAKQRRAFDRLLGPDFDLGLLVRPPRGEGADRDKGHEDRPRGGPKK